MTWLNSVIPWPTSSTKSGENLPAELSIGTDGQQDQLTFVGPSAAGLIYRSQFGPGFYRFISLDDAPLARRDSIRSFVNQPLPAGLASIEKAWRPEELPHFFCVRYVVESDADAQPVSLAEALARLDPRARLSFASRALQALPGWWQWWDVHNQGEGQGPLLPLPADIVFNHDETACLLAVPFWRLPKPQDLFAEPSRALYLAPELLRMVISGQTQDSSSCWKSLDRYALGIALLQCFHKMPTEEQRDGLVERVANGSLFLDSRLQSNLPFWLERTEAAKQAKSAVLHLVTPDPRQRSVVPSEVLAEILAACCLRMEPYVAATELRDSGRPFEAFALIQDILLVQETYEMLVLAADIASQLLVRPLEAVDLLERAIARDSKRIEAYESQFKILASASRLPPLSELMEKSPDTCAQIDAKIARDFQNMPEEEQQHLESEMANFLLWRERWDAAARFIHPRLFDGGTPLWRKFDMNLAYAGALVGLRALTEAEIQLKFVRSKLGEAWNSGVAGEDEIQHYGEILQSYEIFLSALRRQSPPTESTEPGELT